MNAQALMNSFGYCQLHDVVNKTEEYSLKFPKSISISGASSRQLQNMVCLQGLATFSEFKGWSRM